MYAKNPAAAALLLALAGFLVRATLAGTTDGTGDVVSFHGFAQAIERFGPLGIYVHGRPGGLPGLPVYNHPPLMGWILWAMAEAERYGLDFRFLIRLPASLADAASTLLVFAFVNRRRGPNAAIRAAATVAASPVLIEVSGFHGNTDPAAMMLMLCSAYLLVDRRSAAWAGTAAAIAISIKLVPVVAVPALLVVAARLGWRALARFTFGAAVPLVVLWGPPLIRVRAAFCADVLGYQGGPFRLWGIVRFADWLGADRQDIAFLRGDAYLGLVAVCVLTGCLLAWRRPMEAMPVVGVVLCLLLLLSTGSAVQYLSWAALGACAIGPWCALPCNLALGAVTTLVYTYGHSTRWNHQTLYAGAVAWVVLAACTLHAVRLLGFRSDTPADVRESISGRPVPELGALLRGQSRP
jgi:hypothetical protein